MADLPLIAWADVPEGPVWFRLTGRWRMGEKLDGALWVAGDRFPLCRPDSYEFTPAEQQPGEWAALKAELKVTDRLLTERERVLRAIPECPQHGPCVPHALEWIEKSLHLRDGLAALEQTIRATSAADRGDGSASPGTLQRWADRLAALREGQ